jgi:hypothetical protein
VVGYSVLSKQKKIFLSSKRTGLLVALLIFTALALFQFSIAIESYM